MSEESPPPLIAMQLYASSRRGFPDLCDWLERSVSAKVALKEARAQPQRSAIRRGPCPGLPRQHGPIPASPGDSIPWYRSVGHSPPSGTHAFGGGAARSHNFRIISAFPVSPPYFPISIIPAGGGASLGVLNTGYATWGGVFNAC